MWPRVHGGRWRWFIALRGVVLHAGASDEAGGARD